MSKPANPSPCTESEFVRRGTSAIAETKTTGNGIPTEVVLARLEGKLATARHAKAMSRMNRPGQQPSKGEETP